MRAHRKKLEEKFHAMIHELCRHGILQLSRRQRLAFKVSGGNEAYTDEELSGMVPVGTSCVWAFYLEV